MTRFLVVTTSVHVTAAAADYLDERLDPSADEVVVVGVAQPGTPDRDAADAVNVARSRLAAAGPTTETRREDTAPAAVAAAVAEHDPDEVVLGTNAGTPDAEGLAVRDVLGALDRPAVVLPVAP